MSRMFCFQCEQTAKGTGCVGASHGACGKSAETALLQDLLLRLTRELARQQMERSCCSESLDDLTVNALFATISNVDFDPASIEQLCRQVACAIGKRLPNERIDLLQMAERIGIEAERRSVGEEMSNRLELLGLGLKGIAAYYYHACRLGYRDPAIPNFLRRALAYMLHPDLKPKEMVDLTLECGAVNLTAMKLLDRAHHETYGAPEPTRVRISPVHGKAILISGHDMRDLHELLKRTENTGIHVYTHGEMLPAHGYPELRKYKHLAGNYGGAWQDQHQEFAEFPGAILLTTNCLMPPEPEYAKRLFTTGPVRYPGIHHLNANDFQPVIDAALEAPGFPDNELPEKFITVGFGHEAIAGAEDKIVELVKSGKIRHFFLIGGCDGARSGRNYFTRLAEAVPEDCIILTLACGKYRFNKLDFGEIDGIPRLLDLGQCNDAYTAIKIATMLAKAFHCSVNDLPLSIFLSWYEQKAIAVFLSLLALNIKNITIGPTAPAFVSAEMMKILQDKYNVRLISSIDADLEKAFGMKK